MNRIYEQVGDVVTTLAPAIVPKLDTQIKVMAWKKREQKDPRLNDLLWRISNLYFIEDKNGNTVKFKPNIVQRYLLKNLHTRNIILKARQLGMSTFIAILFLDQCLFVAGTKAAIVADKKENGINIFRKIDFAWQKFPKSLKESEGLTSESDSTSEMTWKNGSSFKVGTTLHSGTYQCLHISEYGPLCQASPEKASDVKKSALPTVPDDGGLVFIESTAEGEGNDFHQMCLDAIELEMKLNATQASTDTEEVKRSLSKMQYKFFFFPWYEDPGYTIDEDIQIPVAIAKYLNDLEKQLEITLTKGQKCWYALKAATQKGRMREQYPSTPDEAFLSTGNKQFNADVLNFKMQHEVREPLYVDGDLMVYEHYHRNHAYGIGADVADGVGLDSSTMCVIDFTANRVVATYKSNTIDPVNFAFDLARVGNMYGTCIIAPENARTGHTVCVKLQEMYPNIYEFEIKGGKESRPTTRLGFSTNNATKPRMMASLKSIMEDDENSLFIPDPSIIREARMYAKEDNLVTQSQMAKTTRHFDLLIATAIAWEMRAHCTISMNDPRQKARVERNRERTQTGVRRFK